MASPSYRNTRSASDRKSTRLNSSHPSISYAVFCLNAPASTELSTLSLHDALPILAAAQDGGGAVVLGGAHRRGGDQFGEDGVLRRGAIGDRPAVLHRPALHTDGVTLVPEHSLGLRSEEHTSELQSPVHLVCRLLLECSGVHRALHSFPTRRSSDLSGRAGRWRRGGPWWRAPARWRSVRRGRRPAARSHR